MALTVEDFETQEEFDEWFAEYGQPVRAQEAFTVTCNSCGYSGGLSALKLHSCQIAQNGGRCEDFPCCGHTDGDGCQTLESHTGEFWHNMMERLGQDRYDELDASGYWDQ